MLLSKVCYASLPLKLWPKISSADTFLASKLARRLLTTYFWKKEKLLKANKGV